MLRGAPVAEEHDVVVHDETPPMVVQSFKENLRVTSEFHIETKLFYLLGITCGGAIDIQAVAERHFQVDEFVEAMLPKLHKAPERNFIPVLEGKVTSAVCVKIIEDCPNVYEPSRVGKPIFFLTFF